MASDLSSNMEDYLESILILKTKNNVVRIRDIANDLGLQRSSVALAIKSLAKSKLVEHEKYGYVELTTSGMEIAKKILMRHELILTFLRDVLQVNPKDAALDACKIEHVVSLATVENLSKFVDFLNMCPKGKDELGFTHKFCQFLKTGKKDGCDG